MAQLAKFLSSTAGVASGSGGSLDVDDCFSCHLYDGNNSTQTITNGIDLSGEGGLVWTKTRSVADNHRLTDTARGAGKGLDASNTYAEWTANPSAGIPSGVSSFNSNGFVSDLSHSFFNNENIASWTFRKAPRFFDVVSINVADPEPTTVTVNHNLGQQVGMVIMKPYLHTYPWYVWHRSLNANKYLELNTNAAEASFGGTGFSSTSTTITIPGSFVHSGSSNGKCILYLFSHNNNDGGFGPDSDQDIIKCGSYTGNGSFTGPVVDLGFELQFLMIKSADGSENWQMFDSMRGMPVGGRPISLYPNLSNAEDAFTEHFDITSTGFQLKSQSNRTNANGDTYIYMAIRRGPLAVPEDATKVFSVNTTSGGDNKYSLGFVPDLNINTRTAGDTKYTLTRLLGNTEMRANATTANASYMASVKFWDCPTNTIDLNTSWWGAQSDLVSWSWKRAPGYFDCVCYSGTGSARTVPHGLTVPPEMMWVKRRNITNNWKTFHSSLGGTKSMELNTNVAAETNGSALWNSTAPTASVFSLGTASDVNGSGSTYIAYLFATVPGVSKCGSYTGNDGSTNVDCGFSNGIRFLIIKKTNGNNNWFVFDSSRGVGSGNTPYLKLNTTDAQDDLGARDIIDPYSSGFTVNANMGGVNDNGDTFIFYAIAA
jgi:hypothetical protein